MLNIVIFFGVFKVCVGMGFFVDGKCIYVRIVEVGFVENVYIRYVFVDMYVKCDSCGNVF